MESVLVLLRSLMLSHVVWREVLSNCNHYHYGLQVKNLQKHVRKKSLSVMTKDAICLLWVVWNTYVCINTWVLCSMNEPNIVGVHACVCMWCIIETATSIQQPWLSLNVSIYCMYVLYFTLVPFCSPLQECQDYMKIVQHVVSSAVFSFGSHWGHSQPTPYLAKHLN